MPVQVAVTIPGSEPTAQAVLDGGGLVGMVSDDPGPPRDVPVDFIDWPFQQSNPRFASHLDTVRRREPSIAVAPDVETPGIRDAVIERADQLAEHAGTVILIPKAISPDDVPDRFRIGVPFAGEWSGAVTNFEKFRRTENVHILGGNPIEQRALAERYSLGVESVDTTLPVLWARNGRVFVGRRRGGSEALEIERLDLETEETRLPPTFLEQIRSFHGRIEVTVQNVVKYLNRQEPTIEVEVLSRGPPPAPPRDLVSEEDFQEFERNDGPVRLPQRPDRDPAEDVPEQLVDDQDDRDDDGTQQTTL